MDTASLEIFHTRIEEIVGHTNDMHGLFRIDQSLQKADEELRKQYASDRYFNDVLLKHQVLHRRVQRKLRLAILDGQKRGMVKTRSNNRALYSPKEFSINSAEYILQCALGKLTDEEFEAYLRKGREQGDLGQNNSLRILGQTNKTSVRKTAEIIAMAKQPEMTRSEIAVRLDVSRTHVGRVLKRAEIEIPLGTEEPRYNASLDPNTVLSESLQMLEDMLPALTTADVRKLTAEQAQEYRLLLAPSIGKLRTLARTLKRIEEVNGNTDTGTEARTPEEDHAAGSSEVPEGRRPEGLFGGAA